MTVYVDDMRRHATVGRVRSRWSHLFADTHDELMSFAAAIGLRPEWLQHEGTHREHFDVTDSVRKRAIAAGAVQIRYPHETGALLNRKRTALQSSAVSDDPASGPESTAAGPTATVRTDPRLAREAHGGTREAGSDA